MPGSPPDRLTREGPVNSGLALHRAAQQVATDWTKRS